MRVKCLFAVLIVVPAALFAFSQIGNKAFAPAADFPRAALIYAQFADLPTIIKFWNESKFKEKYTASDNFQTFQNRHLGLKLASRWEEFNAATGFPIDLEALSRLANNQAAIAVYDIGKLEFVFIAPISDEFFTATGFVQNRDKFAAEQLGDGTEIYRATVEADRGRQKQELIYTNVKGRFILATGEKLLAQTLNNINGINAKNRLTDEPSFELLSENSVPGAATVWTNQAALNDDYYFKRYWLMSEAKELKNIRAGLFNFEIQAGKLIERRKFLLYETAEVSPIKNQQAEKLLSFLPANIPFYQLRKTPAKVAGEIIEQNIIKRRETVGKSSQRQFYFSRHDDFTADYENLDERFDETIDEGEETAAVKGTSNCDFSEILESAKPQAALTFTAPKILSAPLFVEFRRAAIFHLEAPDAFDRAIFESAIERCVSENILISSPGVKLIWTTKSDDNFVWRELSLPMLGWTVGYAAYDGKLFLTDHAELLREVVAVQNSPDNAFAGSQLTGLTVIKLDQKEAAYNAVFNELARKNAADAFFTDNVGSLLDSLSHVKTIEIRKNYAQKIVEEEVTCVFR